jgi:hypothetical protein
LNDGGSEQCGVESGILVHFIANVEGDAFCVTWKGDKSKRLTAKELSVPGSEKCFSFRDKEP